MKRFKAAVTTGALAAAGVALIAGAGSAHAVGTATPWVGGDPNAVGGLAFFDSAGNQVLGGNLADRPLAAYTVGVVKPRPNPDTKATLFAFVPTPGQTPDVWSTSEQISSSSAYPNAAAPAPIGTTALPVTTGKATDKGVGVFSSDLPNTSTAAGYQNAYEIRQYVANNNDGASVQYDYADISVNTAAGTWQVVYSPDAPATATTSTLTTTSPSSVPQGTTAHFTDTIAPSAATGTVQFKVNGTNSGSPVAVSGGTASTDIAVALGANSVTAVFTPTGLSGYAASTSNAVSVTGTKVITNTSTALSANPTSGPAFSPVTLTATVTPHAAGTVKFFDNGTQIGSSTVDVNSGVATLVYSHFAQGDHNNITATFVPDDTTTYNGSTSAPVDFNAGAPAGPLPDEQTIQTDVAAGSLAITTPYDAGHPLVVPTLALNANGTELSGTAQFGDGTFGSSPRTPHTGSIQVVDTRAGNANWTASALADNLTGDTGDSINGQNVGLTDLHAVEVANNALKAANLTLTPHSAADPAVAPTDTGSLGLGGSAKAFATTTAGGDGSIGIYGTLTITAPTSTKAGVYTGIVTFTVA